jgi:hypothetical protein
MGAYPGHYGTYSISRQNQTRMEKVSNLSSLGTVGDAYLYLKILDVQSTEGPLLVDTPPSLLSTAAIINHHMLNYATTWAENSMCYNRS